MSRKRYKKERDMDGWHWTKMIFILSLASSLFMIPGKSIATQINGGHKFFSAVSSIFENISQRNTVPPSLKKVISVDYTNTSLKKALNDIAKKGDFRLSYGDNRVPLQKKINLHLDDVTINDVLWKVLDGTGLRFAVSPNRHLVLMERKDQKAESKRTLKETVSGTVKDAESGDTLPGVNVIVKGTTTGTSTDSDGHFQLNVPSLQDTLVFSFIGYQRQIIPIDGRTTINISLKIQTISGEEMVVVGYGSQKKKNLTGSISSVSSDQLQNTPVTRLDAALEGRTSGVRVTSSSGAPGAASTVRVRGTTSINNSNPLYIVDGVPIDNGGISYLNPEDIESIQVLKDAASAAIYGTRAANGVVLVTTKSGSEGHIQVHYSTYGGIQEPAKKLDLLNATQYATLRNESSVAAGNGIIFNNPQQLGKGTDWQSKIFDNRAAILSQNLSFSGGSDKSTYFASLGYYDQEGIVASPISHDKKLTFRLNSTLQATSWLTFGEKLGYTYERTRGSLNTNSEFGGPLSSAINLDPITPAVITDPNVASSNPYSNNPVIRNGQGQPYGISQYVGQEMTNPLAYIQTQEGNYGYSHNIVGNLYADINPIPGLEIRTDIGVKPAFWGNESFTPIYYLSATVNNLTNNSFNRGANQGLIWNWDNTIQYATDYGSHHFKVLLGTSTQSTSASGVNGTYQAIPANNFSDASMNFSVPTDQRIAGGYENQPYGLNSYFGRVNYNYKDKYLLTGVMRVDGSSRFGSDNRYGSFPSLSVGWVPSLEDFWPNNDVLRYLKIRASYGINGNDKSLGDFQYESTVSGGRNYVFGPGTIYTGASPNAPANPDLKWEKTSQLDLGFDARLLSSLTVTFDYYYKKTTGMLLQVQIPGYVGASSNPFGNVASLKDQGAELEVGYQQQLGAFNLNVDANASYNQNTITDIGENDYLTGATFQNSAYEISRTQVGHPIGAFYGFKTEGIFQTQQEVNNYVDKNGNMIQPNAQPGDFKWADLNGDGQITSDDRTFIGNPTPPWTFGLNASVAWRNFDLSVFGQGVYGNKIFQGLRRLDITSANYTTDALGRWTGQGTSNTFPRLSDNDPNHNFTYPSSFYLSDGSYFRIKTIQLGYSLPVTLTNNLGIQKARFYVMSHNLLTFTKYSGYDPEIGGSSYSIDRGVYPQARSFMLGVDLKF
ncbi:MAG TPA: TonB-dependent receptor [Balneolaceae bacterium]|nr:TonB-dependent receptor [Balneolaceae bacterium]